MLPGQEQELSREHQIVSSLVSLWNTYPEAFARLLTILDSARDPFQAIALLKEGKKLTAAEIFIVAHLALTSSRVLSVMKEIGLGRWPDRCVPPSLGDIEKRLFPGTSGQPVFFVDDSYSPELARVRAERRAKEKAWRAEMMKEAEICEKILGKRPGLREELAIRKTSPELIEKARLMPELGEVRETLTHVHFRLKATREAVKLEREIGRLRQREAALEEEVLALLSKELQTRVSDLEKAAWALGELDYLLSKVELAREWRAVVPEIASKPSCVLVLKDAFHPQVRKEVEARGGRFQPVSIEIDDVVSVITGPNMGGKTVTLATIGLCVALAQWGFLVPCSYMSFSLYDFIYFEPGAAEKPGLSSFAAEIMSVKDALSRKHQRGLILLDELARGTNPAQGLALYAAILKSFKSGRKDSTVIASTHFHGLAALISAPHWQVRGLSGDPGRPIGDNGMLANSRDINWLYEHMDYRLQKVGPDAPTPQDAILVAKLLGLDSEIVKTAELLFQESEAFGGH